MIIIIVLLLSLLTASFLAPVMARLSDKATYAFGRWLFKQFPTLEIKKPSNEYTKQRYSRIYIPKPLKDAINYIFRPINRGYGVMENPESIKNGEKSNKYPLGKQSFNTTNNPLLKFKTNFSDKGFHDPKSSTGETDESTKIEPNP